ncbi:MAG: efflux RND transporter permease subunit, partial [Pseudomonadota bacterium]
FALRQHGLSVSDVADIVSRQNVDLPAGTVETEDRDVLVRFADRRRSVQAYEDLVVIGAEGGTELRLRDIAKITDRFDLDEERILLNGERGALLEVTKTKDQDTLKVMAEVEAFVEREHALAPPGVNFELTSDVASIVQDRLNMLLFNGIEGIVLVFLVLWLFFSLRFSFWVALGLPVSFLGALFVMWLLGYSINMLTMVALLIAVGLLMDDAIVIAENVARHAQMGKQHLQAAIDGTREVAMGVVSSFITSVCVFAPLAFLEGDIGKVLMVVPVVLIIVLSVSLIEAFLILPNHLAHAMGTGKRSRFRLRFDTGFAWVREQVLGPFVDAAVSYRYLTVGLVLMLFLISISMIAGGVLKFRAFPDIDGDVVQARVLLPAGTPLADTEAVVARVLAGLEEINTVFTPRQPPGPDGRPQSLVRNVLIQYNANADAKETGPHVATVSVDLLTAEARYGAIDEILSSWRDAVGSVPDVIALTFKDPQIGPAGQAIEIRLEGDDLPTLKAAAQELQQWLGSFAGVNDLMDDLRPGKPEFQLRLREGAIGLGLDASEIARQLRTAFHGSTADEIQVGPESFEIDVRLAPAAQSSLGDVDAFDVVLPGGRRVPLSAVAELETGRGFARIVRVDGQRTVTVVGEIDNQVANLNQILSLTSQQFLPDLLARYPGVAVSLEGEADEQAETGSSLGRGFTFGLLGIFLLLSFQFRSYVEPVIVMIAIPLSLIGVIWGHIVMGLDLTMPSMMGAASLAGIVVNNSILMVAFVKIGLRDNDGRDVIAAACQAARDRFRPMLLTSLTTIAGVTPLLFEKSLQAQILVPLVTSLAFGLMAATALVLIVVPTFYAILADLGISTVGRSRHASADTAAA